MRGSVPLPGSGRYPVPSRHRHDPEVVERGWDGQLWTGEGTTARGATLARCHRDPLGLLRGAGWKPLVLLVVSLALSAALWLGNRKANRVGGVEILLPLFSGVASAAVMVGLIRHLGRRIGFDTIEPERRRSIVRWGLAAAVVAFGFALGVEVGIPTLLGQHLKSQVSWSPLAGPIEEIGKLLLPVILWLTGRFRVPREGFLLVLIAAGGFGVMESCLFGLSPERWQPARPLLEIMHPLFTGFVAVVAWPRAWKCGRLFTAAAFGAWTVAVLAHATNNLVVLEQGASGPFSFITITVILIMYLLLKHEARELVPPDRVAGASPWWRPLAPRHPVYGR